MAYERLKIAKVTNENNIVVQIPKSVRERWALKEGDAVEFLEDLDRPQHIVLRPRRVKHAGQVQEDVLNGETVNN